MLEFDEEGHVYKWQGQVVPSVTQILEPLKNYDMSVISQEVMDNAADRGTAVHLACELHDQGILDESTLDPELRPYLEAWKFFLYSRKVHVEAIEERLYHPTKGYAGQIDRVLAWGPGGAKKPHQRVMGDIKATFEHVETVGPQTAAYLDMWNSTYPSHKCDARVSIRLMNNGKFDLVTLKDKNDIQIFQSCLNVNKWRQRHYG